MKTLLSSGIAASVLFAVPLAAMVDAAPRGAVRTALQTPLIDVLHRPIAPVIHRRIVSVAPALTEMLYAIGAGSDLVADSDYCDYPPLARKLPHIGSLFTLQIEKIVALHPDLIVTASGALDQWRAVEHLAGAPVFVAEDGGIAAIAHNLESLGALTGRLAAARQVEARIDRRVAALAERTHRQARPTVFYMVWNDPLQMAGPGSYLGELIRDAGGRNLAPSGKGLYPRMSWESLVASPPQVLIGPRSLAGALQAAGRKLGVRRVVALDDDIVSHPGPRVVQALGLLYEAIHPTAAEPKARNLVDKPVSFKSGKAPNKR